MGSAPDCPGLRDLAATSGYYCQMTGVLAGFAFSAMIILLPPIGRTDERNFKGRTPGNGVLLTLLVAFIALGIATLSYSLLGGDPKTALGRTVTVEIITGIP